MDISGYYIFAVHRAREEEFSTRLRANANCKGCTALHYAALIDNGEIISLLLDAGKSMKVVSKLVCMI